MRAASQKSFSSPWTYYVFFASYQGVAVLYQHTRFISHQHLSSC
ncbi:hypothetical protein FORC065_0945 [Yersinia enterocolitica]|nr:hypothetical protein FORC065_0945 [Yersinia enterocolitica]